MSEYKPGGVEIPDEWKMYRKDGISPADFISRMEEYFKYKPDLAENYDSNIKWAKSLPPTAKIRWRKDEGKQSFIPYRIE